MSKTFRAVAHSITLDEKQEIDRKVPSRVQLMRTGSFNSPTFGAFEITTQVLLSMKKNFDENVRGNAIAVDYSHESDKAAAGWIKELHLSDNGQELWGVVDWTPIARQRLVDKEYVYLSADFTFNYKHNETGKEFGPTLFGAGLTNRPFIKGMDSVVELSEGKKQMDEKDKIIESLKAEIELLKAKLENKGNGNEGESQEMMDLKKKLAELELKDKQNVEALKCAEKKSAFEKLMQDGKAVEAQRQAYMDGDTVKFSELAQPLNLVFKGSGTQQTQNTSTDGAQEQLLKQAQLLLSEKKAQSMGKAIRMVLDDPKNAELRKKYEEETSVR